MRRPARPVIWAKPPYVESSMGVRMPNIMALSPYFRMFTDPVRLAPEEARRHEAQCYRDKYLRAMRRGNRHRPGSRRWAYHRRAALKYRDRIVTLGHRICAAWFEMHADKSGR